MRPNWPLIAIIAGALLTAAAVVTIFISSAPTAGIAPRVLTTADLASLPDDLSTETVTVSVEGGCAWSTFAGRKSLGVWPEGFTVRDGRLLDADGEQVADTGTASVYRTDEPGALKYADDEGYVGKLLDECFAPIAQDGVPQPGVDIVTEFVG